MTKRNTNTGELFHVLNRGVDKRNIFLDKKDYFRFIHNLFEFNDANPALNFGYYFNKKESTKSIDSGNQYSHKPREQIVEILAFCLMPNHFHLIIKQKQKNGLIKFMLKLGAGYANYFNKKYQRSGTLFQGRYKVIPIEKDSHLFHLPYYIHLNPLELISQKWKEGKIENYKKTIDFLESYRWSSHLDYIGRKNFPSITERSLLLKIFRGSENYKKTVKNWLKEKNSTKLKELILE